MGASKKKRASKKMGASKKKRASKKMGASKKSGRCDFVESKAQVNPARGNYLPNINSNDDGTWRRIKVIPFPSKFIISSDAINSIKNNVLEKDQFWADTNLSKKLPEWKQTFMAKLIHYYKKYKANELIHPESVIKCTINYRT
jgi:phage/plasmid-associated DNA primase